MEGACERYEEAALDAQRDDLMRGLRRARALVEDHGDELAGPRQSALDVDSASGLVRRRLALVERVRSELLRSPAANAAYVVISQRPSPTGSHLLVKINEFEDAYLGKADNLTKLARLAGDRLYSSPDYRWLEVADHWIEAIPLFIKEEVLIDDEGVESTRTVIDIDGMEESFREEMADHWAANLRDVADSECVSAARWLLCRETGEEGDEAAALDWARASDGDLSGDIACAAALVSRLAAENAGDLRRRIEGEEEEPFEALCALLSAWAPSPASSLARTLRVSELESENATLREAFADEHRILGESEPIVALRRQIERTAPTEAAVLITGDNGTGKELVARQIHALSRRRARPFVAVNCAAIPESLIESELFGHERGAFTGAHASRAGCFEAAHGGTLFLDEIGDMAIGAQAKLLRALQEQVVTRLGGRQEIAVDVRIVAATNQDLAQRVADKEFREDLYYRLRVVPLHVPALRERREDVPTLARHFLREAAQRNGLPLREPSAGAIDWLRAQSWPGNVRELRNLCEAATILTDGDQVTDQDLRSVAATATAPKDGDFFSMPTLEDFRASTEREFIRRKLEENGGNIKRTAERIGIQRSNLYKKLDRYGLK